VADVHGEVQLIAWKDTFPKYFECSFIRSLENTEWAKNCTSSIHQIYVTVYEDKLKWFSRKRSRTSHKQLEPCSYYAVVKYSS